MVQKLGRRFCCGTFDAPAVLRTAARVWLVGELVCEFVYHAQEYSFNNLTGTEAVVGVTVAVVRVCGAMAGAEGGAAIGMKLGATIGHERIGLWIGVFVGSFVGAYMGEQLVYCGADLLTEKQVADCYTVLGTTPEATDREVKFAYRKKAIRMHPAKQSWSSFTENDFLRLQTCMDLVRHIRSM